MNLVYLSKNEGKSLERKHVRPRTRTTAERRYKQQHILTHTTSTHTPMQPSTAHNTHEPTRKQVPMGANRYKWVQPGTNGCNQVPMGATRYQWVQPGTNGCHQVPMGATRYQWVQPGTNGCKQVPMGATRYQWVPPGTNGCKQVPMGATRYQWVQPGTNGCQPPPIGTAGCQTNPLTCTTGHMLTTSYASR
jgi:hypothetical protein